MLPEIPRKMLDGLIDAAELLGSAVTLKALWANSAKYEKHVDKRIAIGHAVSAADYQQRTFLTLSKAESIVVVHDQNPAMFATGKVQIRSGDWLVLLSEAGKIVTSYRIDLRQVQFEQRHREKGDQVYEYEIDAATRKRLAGLFGAG
jgi:hypothetical protein